MAVPVLTDPQPFLFLSHHARQRPDTVAMSTIERDYTFAETYAYARALAGLFRERGIAPGDVVACRVANSLQLFFLEAVFHEAAIWCNPPSDDVLLGPVGVDWLVSPTPVEGFAESRTIIIDDDVLRGLNTSTFVGAPRAYPSMDSVCRLTFSSGTTGVPLAIPSTVARQENVNRDATDHYPFLSLMRGFVGSGAKSATNAMCEGDTFVCSGSPEDNVTLAQRNFVATIHGSPLQIAEFLDILEQRENQETSIVDVQFIGSYLPQALLERIHRVLGATVTALYGSSEVGYVTRRKPVTGDTHNVGRPLPTAEVQIVSVDGEVLPPMTEGIVRARTTRPNVRYFRADDETREHVRDGWFYPGDLGRLNLEGELELVGRASEVVNIGGVKFNPEVLDAKVVAMAGVTDAATVLWDTDSGPGYAVLVVTDDDFDVASLTDPIRIASGGLTPAAIFRVPSIQRGVTGKVQRAAMATWVRSVLDGA